MGTWNVGIFDNDTTLDVQDMFLENLKKYESVEIIEDLIIEWFTKTREIAVMKGDIMAALALTEIKVNKLTERTKDESLKRLKEKRMLYGFKKEDLEKRKIVIKEAIETIEKAVAGKGYDILYLKDENEYWSNNKALNRMESNMLSFWRHKGVLKVEDGEEEAISWHKREKVYNYHSELIDVKMALIEIKYGILTLKAKKRALKALENKSILNCYNGDKALIRQKYIENLRLQISNSNVASKDAKDNFLNNLRKQTPKY